MSQAVIENPVINSPFIEPARHFRFTDECITDDIIEERRCSSYFIPIARPKKKGKQLVLDTDWTQDRIEENRFVNRVRERVTQWRTRGYVGATAVTRRFLDYWNDGNRERKLFFCQVEALETAVYITEVAGKHGRRRAHRVETRPEPQSSRSAAASGVSQVELANRLQSSQSRIAKMEAGDPSVSMDLLVSSLLVLGASEADLAKAIRGEGRKGRHAAA